MNVLCYFWILTDPKLLNSNIGFYYFYMASMVETGIKHKERINTLYKSVNVAIQAC